MSERGSDRRTVSQKALRLHCDGVDRQPQALCQIESIHGRGAWIAGRKDALGLTERFRVIYPTHWGYSPTQCHLFSYPGATRTLPAPERQGERDI
jgi:hypothetical protein